MAGGKANFLSNKLLNLLFNGTAYSTPATIYCALFTVTPSSSGGGTEVTGGSYARIGLTANNTNFPVTSSQTIQNAVLFNFGTASAGWGTVVAAALFDNVSGGNMLYWGPLSTSRVVLNGDSFNVPVNGLTVTEA